MYVKWDGLLSLASEVWHVYCPHNMPLTFLAQCIPDGERQESSENDLHESPCEVTVKPGWKLSVRIWLSLSFHVNDFSGVVEEDSKCTVEKVEMPYLFRHSQVLGEILGLGERELAG